MNEEYSMFVIFQILDALDLMLDQKHYPEVESIRNMLLSKARVAGIMILCDLLNEKNMKGSIEIAKHIKT